MRSVILIIMNLKIRLKILLKKKEKFLSEYVQISVRGLSKQGLTLSLQMAQQPITRMLVCPTAPNRTAQCFPPRKMVQQWGFQDKHGAHTQTLGSHSVCRQSGLGGDTQLLVRGSGHWLCHRDDVSAPQCLQQAWPNVPRLALEKH